MNRSVGILFVAILGSFLAGCDVDSEFDIYLRDIKQVAEENDVNRVPVNATFSVEVPSRDECVKRKEKLEAVVQKYFDSSKNVECTQTNSSMQNFLRFTANTSAYKLNEDNEIATSRETRQILYFGAGKMEKGGEYGLMTFFDQEVFTALTQELEGSFDVMASIDLELASIVYNVRNDYREGVKVGMVPSYLDGKPVTSTNYAFNLGYRDTSEIALADVYVDGLTEYGRSYDIGFWSEEDAEE